jgi:hypothetical protein
METQRVKLYVDAPSQGPVQGVWCFPPARDEGPDDVWRTVSEGLVITDLNSLKQFFREKCRWSDEAVGYITHAIFLERQTWDEQ